MFVTVTAPATFPAFSSPKEYNIWGSDPVKAIERNGSKNSILEAFSISFSVEYSQETRPSRPLFP
ncbi:hypothetical protein WG66_014269 [Moniliophthora roreri]|nr:hypothetical protein WG66_014269 [Moniliophthora roreri]